MNEKPNTIIRVVKIILTLDIIAIFIPWLALAPVANSFFPENFISYGWMYSLFAIIALVPILIIYVILNRGNKETSQVSKVNRISNRIAWTLIIGCVLFWAISMTGFFG